MLDLWNELVPEKAVSSLDKFLKNDLEISFREQLDNDLASWKNVCENFKTSKFLMGEVDRISVKPDLSWLVNPKAPHVTRVLTKTYWTFGDRAISKKIKIDFEAMEKGIEALDESLIAKQVRLFVFQSNAVFYHDWIMNGSVVESDGETVYLNVATGFKRDRIDENYGSAIRGFLKERYQMGFEIKHKKN